MTLSKTWNTWDVAFLDHSVDFPPPFSVLHDERRSSTQLSLIQTYVLSHVKDWGSEEEEGATQGRDITNEIVEVEQTAERV